ncbi:hypothetical protein L1049_026067 [Liquidambar formosana]|uniref:NAC domain-containing protein n=1 Tax=Liquidambar formosana TaxID=63359 RepID=A0AAP0NE41_LIQFO
MEVIINDQNSQPKRKDSLTAHMSGGTTSPPSPTKLPLPPLITAPNSINGASLNGASSVDDDGCNINSEYFNSMPPGYWFCPRDDELILHYLKKKVMNEALPLNNIMEVNLYRHNPEKLAEKFKLFREKEWYFFTPRDRKYRNGSRPNRAAGDGYWKATGADRKIKATDENDAVVVVGLRNALVFYKGRPPRGIKTNWIMHEYRLNDPPRIKRSANDMKLDDWVLCRIYKKAGKLKKIQQKDEEPVTVENSPVASESSPVASDEVKDEGMGMGMGMKMNVGSTNYILPAFQNGLFNSPQVGHVSQLSNIPQGGYGYVSFGNFPNLGDHIPVESHNYGTWPTMVEPVDSRLPWMPPPEIFRSTFLREHSGCPQEDLCDLTNLEYGDLPLHSDLGNYNYVDSYINYDNEFAT